MLTGEQPYKGEQPMQIAFQHATDSVPRPSVKNPGVPEQLDELVLWATEKVPDDRPLDARSEEHTSELQSLMRISYAVFCLKKKKKVRNQQKYDPTPTLE